MQVSARLGVPHLLFATSTSRYVVDPLVVVKLGLEYPPYGDCREGRVGPPSPSRRPA
jgi:hypothetical protein